MKPTSIFTLPNNFARYYFPLLVIAAIGLRLVFFVVSCIHVPPTGDEGILMLQAKHIWQTGEMPLLFWAQPYTFPLESYLNAPLTGILPNDAFGARFLFWAWGLLALVLALLIMRKLGSLRETWPGHLLLLFPSVYLLTIQSAYAPPSYPSFIGLMLAAIYFANLSRETITGKRRLIWVLLSGISGGLACSVTLLATPVLLALGLFYGMGGKFWRSIRDSLLFCASAFLGLLPYIWAKISIPGAYVAVSGYRSVHDTLAKIWLTAIQYTLPGSFGIRYPYFPDLTKKPASSFSGLTEVFPWLWLALFCAVVILGGCRLYKNTRNSGWPRLDRAHIFTIIAVCDIVLFGLSNRAMSHSYRYLLPAVMSFPFQLAYLYKHSRKPLQFMLAGIGVFLVFINVVHSYKLIAAWRQPHFARVYADAPSVQPVIDFLDRQGITYAYGSWFSSHRITYATDSRIISGQYYNERFYGWPTPFKTQIDARKKVAFILDTTRSLSPKRFETEIKRVFPEISYRKQKCGVYTVYSNFVYKQGADRKLIDARDLNVTVSHNPELAAALLDGDPIHRWHTDSKQEQGMFIDIQLPEKLRISHMALYYNRHHRGQAGKLTIMAVQDGQLVPIKEDIKKDASVLDMRNGHLVPGDEVQHIYLPAVKTSRLRVKISEANPHVEWSVGEIKLYRR